MDLEAAEVEAAEVEATEVEAGAVVVDEVEVVIITELPMVMNSLKNNSKKLKVQLFNLNLTLILSCQKSMF